MCTDFEIHFWTFTGDSGYPLRPWLIVPFDDPEEGTFEEFFNDIFLPARSSMERGNGLIKMLFRCVLKHRVLHYSPTVSSKIVNSCVVLHNFRKRFHLREYLFNAFPDPAAHFLDIENFDNVEQGRISRRHLLETLFAWKNNNLYCT